MKHYKLNSETTKKGERSYNSKCGQKNMSHNQLSSTLTKITCPECILKLMTDFENKIATLEDRYEELFPNRPVGEKMQ